MTRARGGQSTFLRWALRELHDALGLHAIKANKHVDHAAIGQDKLIVDGIELTVEVHLFSAGTRRIFRLLQELRLTPQLMTPALLALGPFKRRK